MKGLVLLLFTAALLAQTGRPQALWVGGDALYETTDEYRANNPDCFLPKESLPANYKVWRWTDQGEKHFSCRITSRGNAEFQLHGLPAQVRQTVLVNDRVAAIFYTFRHRNLRALARILRADLGQPTEQKMDGYSGHDGCRGEEIHWTNAVSDVVLIDQCERDDGAAALNLFYTRVDDLSVENGRRNF
jgi:hypothetical protein